MRFKVEEGRPLKETWFIFFFFFFFSPLLFFSFLLYCLSIAALFAMGRGDGTTSPFFPFSLLFFFPLPSWRTYSCFGKTGQGAVRLYGFPFFFFFLSVLPSRPCLEDLLTTVKPQEGSKGVTPFSFFFAFFFFSLLLFGGSGVGCVLEGKKGDFSLFFFLSGSEAGPAAALLFLFPPPFNSAGVF